MIDQVRAGNLLVASPGMHESIFDRTVIILLENDDEGSTGLVLNRPSEITASSALPPAAGLAIPDRVFLGGPVEEGTALVLAEPHDPAMSELHFARNGIGLLDLGGMDLFDQQHLARIRVFSGYAGWGPNQLNEELNAGAWIPTDALPEDIWHVDSNTLWAKVLRRQGGMTRFLASYPDQPWLN